MKKLLSMILTVAMLTLVCLPMSVSAVNYVDRVKFEIDYPVDGVELKTTAYKYEFWDAQKVGYSWDYPATEINGIAWYKKSDPSTPLAKGTKAVLGETYIVSILINATDGHAIVSDMGSKENTINGQPANVTSYGGGGVTYWEFTYEFKAVAGISGKPVVNYTEMNLTPYEGCPAEFKVSATGTNLKYQWQLCYGDYEDGSGTLEWSGAIEVGSSSWYSGGTTDHFKIYTEFDSTFVEDMDWMEVRCMVSSDTGISYTNGIWFTVIPRTELDNITVSDLDKPIYGRTPDMAASTLEEDKYSVSKIEWYGPKDNSGNYPLMKDGEKFGEGDYYCRLHITPEDQYKFGSSTKAYVNLARKTLNTIDGGESNPIGPDQYYIDVNYTVVNDLKPVNSVSVDVVQPVTGENVSYQITLPADAPYEISTEYDAKGMKWNYNGAFLGDNHNYQNGREYTAYVYIKPKPGYAFSKDVQAVINGNDAHVGWYTDTGELRLMYTFTASAEAPLYYVGLTPEHTTGTSLTKINATVGEEFTISYNTNTLSQDFKDKGYEITRNLVMSKGFETVYVNITDDKGEDPISYTHKFTEEGTYLIVVSIALKKNGTGVANDLRTYSVTVTKPLSTPGDVNRDTKINLADVSLMLKHIAKWDVELDTDAADVTDDGKINLGDVSLMLKYIAKWDVELK